jgi:hypothetical protein
MEKQGRGESKREKGPQSNKKDTMADSKAYPLADSELTIALLDLVQSVSALLVLFEYRIVSLFVNNWRYVCDLDGMVFML